VSGDLRLPGSLTSADISLAAWSGLEVQARLLSWWAGWDGVWLATVGWQSSALDEVPSNAGFLKNSFRKQQKMNEEICR